jgi:hypothetical protein
MAHQTSTIQREQTTPQAIGRLMDADVSWVHSSSLYRNPARPWHPRRNRTCVTAVKGCGSIGSRSNYKAAVALQCLVRNG